MTTKTIELSEIAVARLTQLGLDQLLTCLEMAPISKLSSGIPALGQVWPGQGGFFAGIARDENGGPDYALILSPAEGDLDSMPWSDALTKSAAFTFEGHSDYKAPTQRQLNLCYANVPELFQKTWYWSSTQYSSYDAWCQNFFDGYQSGLGKGSSDRVRAVRRGPVINSVIQ